MGFPGKQMFEIYTVLRDLGPAANTIILAVVAYFMREMRVELRSMNERVDIIADRTSTLEGINRGEVQERTRKRGLL